MLYQYVIDSVFVLQTIQFNLHIQYFKTCYFHLLQLLMPNSLFIVPSEEEEMRNYVLLFL